MQADRRPDEREWRIRVRLAEAHLRGAEAGAFDAAVTTLLQAMVGKDAEGRALEVPMATRVEAAVALLRHAKDVSTLLSGYLGPMPDPIKAEQRRPPRAVHKPQRPPGGPDPRRPGAAGAPGDGGRGGRGPGSG